MPSIADMADNNGRLNYRQLVDFVSKYPMSYFTELSRHPFLVGNDLYEGDLNRNLASSASTMRFNVSHLRSSLAGDLASEGDKYAAITHAIYALRKRPLSSGPPNVVSIGRTAENDIVVADYAVSKRHADIIIFHDMYFIVDLGTTNGTRVNGHVLKPNVKVKLDVGSRVAFGRLVFVFMSPVDLYTALTA